MIHKASFHPMSILDESLRKIEDKLKLPLSVHYVNINLNKDRLNYQDFLQNNLQPHDIKPYSDYKIKINHV